MQCGCGDSCLDKEYRHGHGFVEAAADVVELCALIWMSSLLINGSKILPAIILNHFIGH